MNVMTVTRAEWKGCKARLLEIAQIFADIFGDIMVKDERGKILWTLRAQN